ncbi:tetratricopeptide repeat protein [Motilimonas sp. 1_MG-2023]|uniref:YfgM family protein n=1 Tax=Motilimonas sp. 1_MG-2023 TaxID=3062672 RepID=UPI0026E31096|nr:tetratricopeptide repeat protein [Motilimonas sp. 1_MG-2023]MDO6527998.1 tetratricopeptide repeat protein [Motilimonas sp. 1_MG-2023]
MVGYETEEQQVDAIKNWWKENGTAVIFGTVIGLGSLWGWRFYNEQKIASQEQASQAYTQAITTLETGSEDAISSTQAFIDSNADNNYGTLAALMLAKVAVDKGDFELALSQLEWAKKNKVSEVLLPTVNLRLARVQTELKQFDAALATLAEVKDDAFKAKAEEAKGDILLLQGQAQKARAAYQSAVLAGGNTGNPALQIKLDDLAETTLTDEVVNG